MEPASENTQAKAKGTTETAPLNLPPVRHTREELMHMHAKDLIQMLDERHVDHTAVVEKPELVDLILERCTH
ncbi:hypothetical protein BGX29_001595 [Mortierella sp. GBA35]|nr:hypothetical protein BGX23_007618 [Mortierella sp. AD031]KAF9108318.1 hypothetical protein BGX29_001595 [Mortierella sp. GBA35]KAG0210834.1 hypothetical protein BGX33_004643 [Mortierella sp. NVP41]